MKTTITAKLKLHRDSRQFAALRATQLAYRDALNAVSRYAFEHDKTSQVMTLHKGMYNEIRARFHLPSQLACSVERQVGATYKGLWTKVRKNAEQRKAKITKKRYKGMHQPPRFVNPTLTYTYQRDYTLKKEQHVSVLTLAGRVSIPYTGYSEHVKLIHQGAEIEAAKLWYDKAKKRLYLLVTFEVEVPDPIPESHTQVIGVDVGIRYLAVTSTTKGKSTFHTGRRVRGKANHYARLRKRLQRKGTRSATRRLVAIANRERRLKADANHCVSKHIVDQHPYSLIGLEHLTDIRERTKRKRGKKASQKQRKCHLLEVVVC